MLKFDLKNFDILGPLTCSEVDDVEQWFAVATELVHLAVDVSPILVAAALKKKLDGRAINLCSNIPLDKNYLVNLRKIVYSTTERLYWSAFLLSFKFDGGDLAGYATTMKRLSFRVNDKEDEDMVVLKILNGVDQVTRDKILLMKYDSFGSLMESISRISAFKVMSVSTVADGNALLFNNNNNNNNNNRNNENRDNNTRSSIKCFRCGNQGHVRYDCHARRHANGKLLFVEEEKKDVNYALVSRIDDDLKVTCDVRVDGEMLRGVVDTGANVCLMKKMKDGIKTEKGVLHLNTAKGVMKLSNFKEVEFFIDGRLFRHKFWVCPDLPVDVLLGMDFLNGKIIIDLVDKCVRFRESEVKGKRIPEVGNIRDMTELRDFILENQAKISKGEVMRKINDSNLNEVDLNEEMKLVLKNIENNDLREVVKYWMKKWIKREEENKGRWVGSVLPEHKINYDGPYVNIKPQRIRDRPRLEFISKKVEEYLGKGIMIKEPLNNPSRFNSTIICAPKTDSKDKLRFAVNYAPINKYINPPRHPIPLLETIAHRCKGGYLSKFDIQDGYYNIKLTKDSYQYTAVQTDTGRYWLTCLQPGLVGGAEAFQYRIEELMNMEPSMLHKNVDPYQDDLLCWSEDVDDHIVIVWKLMERLFAARIKPNWGKSVCAKRELEWCGRMISENGFKSMTKKAQAIIDIKSPASYEEMKSFYHMALWHAQFIPKYGDILWPLVDCMRKSKNGRMRFKEVWNEKCERSVQRIKESIVKAAELHRDGEGDYHIYTDSSEHQAGGHLIRRWNNKTYLMGYYSHVYNEREDKYSIPQKELLAMFLCCKHWKYLISGRNLIIHTDAKSWEGLKLVNPTGMIAGWLMSILEVCPKVVAIPGVENVVADALSRLKIINNALVSVVSNEEGKKIFDSLHGGKIGGHFGIENTIIEIKKRGEWPDMNVDIKKWYVECEFCQRYKKKQNTLTNNEMIPISSSSPWETIGLDVVSYTLPSGVKKEFALFVCYFSKEVKASNLHSSTAEVIIDKLIKEVEWVERCPKMIVTDDGSQFKSDLFKSYCLERNIEHRSSLPYRHQANGQVERMVQSFKEILTSKVVEHNMKWKDALKATSSAMNNYLPSKSTGYTPHELSRGYEYKSHINNIVKGRKIANKKLEVSKSLQKKYYDKKVSNREFEEGDWVMLENINKKTSSDPLRVGPFQVIKILENSNYLVYNHIRNLYLPYNISIMSKFNAVSEPNSNLSDNINAKNINTNTNVNNVSMNNSNTNNNTNNSKNSSIIVKSPVKAISKEAELKSPTKNITSPFKTREKERNNDIVGKRVSVYWKDYNNWYEGEVVKKEGGKYEVRYDDDKEKGLDPIIEDLDKEEWKLV